MIRKVKWKDHVVLGNLELDFSKSDGSIYSTVVLAGENGSGKTSVLETLSTFLNLGSIEPFDYISYEAGGTPYTIVPEPAGGANLGHHSRKNDIDGSAVTVYSGRGIGQQSIESDPADLRHYGVSYSRARSGFNTQKVRSTTTQQLDSEKYESDSSDDFTSIKQLIIDVNAQDNAAWMEITESGVRTSYEEFRQSSKMARFKRAFNGFFDELEFKGVDHTDPDELGIVFEKHGRKVPIDSLSTGEKQIVFRGAHLLRNIGSISGGVALIDEPELSLHPKWQQGVLRYYRDLFGGNGAQDAQIIVATHSEYVLRSALEDKDNVLVIVLSDDEGTIKSRRITAPSVLPTVTSAETNYLAFGVPSPDYHIELYGYLQNKLGLDRVKECDDYIYDSSHYNPTLHARSSSFTDKSGHTRNYKTLPTYIRNAIDHPDPNRSYTQEELGRSIQLLIELCR